MLGNRHSFSGLSLVILHRLLCLSDGSFFIQVIILAEKSCSILRIRSTLLAACQQFLLVPKGSLDVVEAGGEVARSLDLATCQAPTHLSALQLDSAEGLLSCGQGNLLRPNLTRLGSHLCIASQTSWNATCEEARDLPGGGWPLLGQRLVLLCHLMSYNLAIITRVDLGQRCGRLHA